MSSGFVGASIFAKLAFIGLILGLIFLIIGFPTNYWIDYYRHFGIWNGAHNVHWVNAVRAMCLIGLFCGIGALAMVILTMFIHRFSNNKLLVLLALLGSLAAGISILIGITIFGTKYESRSLGWSFALTTVSGIIYLVCAGLLMAERK